LSTASRRCRPEQSPDARVGENARVPAYTLTAWRAVLNAHSAVVARVEEALGEAALPPLPWYDVLWAIRRAAERRVRMAELAESLTLSRGGLTKLADRLETAGLLRREPVNDDGRGLYAVLTQAGEEMLQRMWPVYSRVLRETFVDAISADEATVIATALDRAKAAAAASLQTP
jgi:DNA-binding MarR family transcriptional regulator